MTLEAMKKSIMTILDEPMTIPAICKRLKSNDEYKIMAALAHLENENLVIMTGFDKFYEPDGCAGYLAMYGRKA
jgi:hypothetical protein